MKPQVVTKEWIDFVGVFISGRNLPLSFKNGSRFLWKKEWKILVKRKCADVHVYAPIQIYQFCFHIQFLVEAMPK